MDTLYSLTLLISLVSGGLAIVLSILSRSPRVLIILAIAALTVSVLVHFAAGHRPGTPEAVSLPEFLHLHPAFIIAALLPAIAATLKRLRPS